MPPAVEMTPHRTSWRTGGRLPSALPDLAVAVGAMAANLIVLVPGWPDHRTFVVVHVAMSGALAVAGLAMADDPAQRGMGRLLVVDAYLQVLPVLSWRDAGPTSWLSWVLGPLAIVPVGVVLLAYPTGRLRRLARWWVVAVATWLAGGRIVLGLFPPTQQAGWWPTLLHDGLVRTIIDAAYNAGGLGAIVFFGLLLVRRWRQTGGLDRVVDAPIAVASAAVGVTAAVHLVAFLTGGETRGDWAAAVSDLALAVVPLSFIAVALARRLLYASVATALGRLPAAATPVDVQDALCAALHDRDLEVLYWVDSADGYVDAEGSPADPSTSAGRLDVTSEASDGSPLAIIRVDARAHRYPELLASALRLGTLALENARLQAALLARLQEVRESRARLVTAGLVERRRIERDLHDGAQQHLLAVASTLGRLRHNATDDATLALVDEARAQLRDSLKQLRDLAHGIHPALLTEGGLGPAIDGVAENLPIAVQISVPDRRWPLNVEATAYFVACEALTNAAKHARDSCVVVTVAGDDAALELTFVDDGDGGARLDAGSGLRGVNDRVAALGGQIAVTSPRGAGTRIEVTLPCG